MYSSLKIKGVYRTKKDNVDTDLIIPLLNKSIKYDRGTGYFSIEALAGLAEGLIPYIRNNGENTKIRIVTSVELSPEDRAIIQRGEEKTINVNVRTIEKEILKEVEGNAVSLNLDLIMNLIAAGMLEIKIGYLKDGGIYHEKVGLSEDQDGEKVCFIGSQNETYSGYKRNVECISVLKSWREEDPDDIQEQEEYFEDLWNNNDDDIEVYSFPEALIKNLFTKYKYSSDVEHAIKRIEESFCQKINTYKKTLHDYQEVAINQFTNNEYCHFFEMATGTGKTFTAVKAVERIGVEKKQLYVLVLVPQEDLQPQWEKAFLELGFESYLFGGTSKESDWNDALNRSIIDYFNDEKPVISICIYNTFFSKICDALEKENIEILIIVDEAHELSPSQINKLSLKFKYRLGLSATPERHNQTETDAIVSYFTRDRVEPYVYTIDEAISKKFLSHYEYYPIWVRLNPDEFEQYRIITQQMIVIQNQDPVDYEALKERAQTRGVILKKASNKVVELERMILEGYNFRNSVVYCGQGKDNEVDEKIIDIVTRLLRNKGRFQVSQFTSRTENRKLVLAEFERGYYDTLVAIRCFDQGVDVPKLDKIYIMASDALMRQTIQRRGRVLRQCKETGKEMAYIYDMVVLPPEGIFDGVGTGSLVKHELRRVHEYMRLADNKEYFEEEIENIIEAYGIGEQEDGTEE